MRKVESIKVQRKKNPLDSTCCEQFSFHLQEKEKIVVYQSYFRLYLLRANYWNTATIYFCPWCGKKLPKHLANSFFETIQAELETLAMTDDFDKLPQEFRTDEWWKKRGL